MMRHWTYLTGFLCCAGCVTSHPLAVLPSADSPAPYREASPSKSPSIDAPSAAEKVALAASRPPAEPLSQSEPIEAPAIDEASLETANSNPEPPKSRVTLSAYRPADESSASRAGIASESILATEEHQDPVDSGGGPAQETNRFIRSVNEYDSTPVPIDATDVNTLDLNLPTALSMVGGQHPAVGFAQWRVQEAYAQLDQAEILWLPSLQAGFSFHKHDGNTQTTTGEIVDLHRNSFQYGLGTGANAAGTTPNPGLVAQFHLADAIFQPAIAEKTAWARGHAANGVVNQQLLRVALAYLRLLDAYQDARIVEETRDRTVELSKLTSDFAATGQGLQADADRVRTDLTLLEGRVVTAREEIEIASARLAQELSIDAERQIVPLDPTVVPIEVVSLEADKPAMIRTGLANRPELKESQALVAAANEAYRRQRYAPFVPSVLLGFSTGGFGGGRGSGLSNIDNRYDLDAVVTWEVRNLGFGEGAARRESSAQIQQARFERIRVMDQVAREVAEARAQVSHRGERISITQRAIESAENSYERNLTRIRDGQGLPIEVLQSVQAREDAQRAYLKSIIDYNEAQFRLQHALGWPVSAPAQPAEGEYF